MASIAHLARRFAGSVSTRPPVDLDEAWARSHLLDAEVTLWDRMGPADRRHSIEVARRFVELAAASGTTIDRPAIAAALLHDVGKLDSGLGTCSRVLATVIGPKGDRFRRYHDHEVIGARMLADAGSDPLTTALVGRAPGTPGALIELLCAADDI
jgi:putative nucleotidyltransferase with HDIG domain